MQSARPRAALSLPLVAILASVLTLLVLLAISTYRNLDRERLRTEEFLLQQGNVIIRGLEAGARTGMMRMAWQDEILQALVEEVTQSSNLAGVRILEADGRAVAESHATGLNWKISLPAPMGELLEDQEPRGWRQQNLYVVAKRFVPTGGLGGMMGHGGGMSPMPWAGGRGAWQRPPPPPRVVLVGLFLEPYLESQRKDIRRAVFLGIVLLIMGSAGLYFIFVWQNLHLVRKTLHSMTTYMGHLVEHMPDGLISVGSDGNILTVNGRARALLSIADSPLGQPSEALGPELNSLLAKVRAGQRVLGQEVEVPTPQGGSVPVAISATQVRGREGEDLGVVMLLRDLRELRSLQERLRRSERLAALGGLAAGVAHEIRNPLSSIRGFAQLFRKRLTPGTEEHTYAEIMVQEVDRLNRVIANLLDFARPKELVLRDIQPREVVDHAVGLVRSQAEAKGVRISVDGEAPVQKADPDQLTQAVLNLLLNALEAMEREGEMGVQVASEGRGWTVEVWDSGPGIPKEHLPRLFDPFFTTKPRGTGLGLAIVHRIVENHGGTITVESQEGKGTRFTLRFPESRGTEEASKSGID